jgi:EGF-like domain
MSGTNSHISMISMPQDGDEAVCPDQHVCHNGAMCVEYPDKEGRYMCDCEASTDPDSVYAGLSCEHVATVYCNFENRLSPTSFCTNGGTCVENSAAQGDKHFGCICTDAYTGDVRI